jgi:hypothetical protein
MAYAGHCDWLLLCTVISIFTNSTIRKLVPDTPVWTVRGVRQHFLRHSPTNFVMTQYTKGAMFCMVQLALESGVAICDPVSNKVYLNHQGVNDITRLSAEMRKIMQQQNHLRVE